MCSERMKLNLRCILFYPQEIYVKKWLKRQIPIFATHCNVASWMLSVKQLKKLIFATVLSWHPWCMCLNEFVQKIVKSATANEIVVELFKYTSQRLVHIYWSCCISFCINWITMIFVFLSSLMITLSFA